MEFLLMLKDVMFCGLFLNIGELQWHDVLVKK